MILTWDLICKRALKQSVERCPRSWFLAGWTLGNIQSVSYKSLSPKFSGDVIKLQYAYILQLWWAALKMIQTRNCTIPTLVTDVFMSCETWRSENVRGREMRDALLFICVQSRCLVPFRRLQLQITYGTVCPSQLFTWKTSCFSFLARQIPGFRVLNLHGDL